jgi:hypothetical protein
LACAFYLESGLTQDKANSSCLELGARLPEIYSKEDNKNIGNFLVKL